MAPSLPPDATQDLQDQIDEHWLAHVYKPHEPQATARALAAGCFLGGIMSVANIYIGMKVGWSVGMALTSTILAFSLFAVLKSLGIVRRDLTMLENNIVASTGSAAGYFSAAGMVSAIPALFLTQNRSLTPVELSIWMLGVSFVGVLMAVPMRRQMIDVDRLPFPSGIACAETIRAMHDKATEALARARALLVAAFIGAAFEIPYSVGQLGKLFNPITWAEYILLPGRIAGRPLVDFGLKLNSSLLMYALGGILGLRVGLSLAAGALMTYAIIAPWLATHGVVVPGNATIFRTVTSWSIWPGVLMVVVASMLSFALKWRTIVSAFGTLARLFTRGARPSKMAVVEVPGSWFGWGMLAATAWVAISAYVIFGIPIWIGVLGVLVAFLMSIVACRSAGETDIAPIGPLGKVAQLLYAGVHPGNYATNLMSAQVTAGAAAHSSDLLTDLKTGYLLGGAPRPQFLAQLLGILAGGLFCVPAYLIVVRPEKIASPELPAPAAQQWAAVADLLASGVSYQDRGPGAAVPATVQTLFLTKRLPGVVPGDELRITDGPNAGSYRITMIDRAAIVLDREVPVADGEGEPYAARIVAPDGHERGATWVERMAAARPALRFTRKPATAARGDYVIAVVDGRDVYQRMIGLDGDLAMLDHAFPGGGGTTPVVVKKMGLPPYALELTIGTILFGILVTLLEVYGPRRWLPYLPSVSGIGLAWVVGCWDSLAMAIGAVVAYLFSKLSPRLGERYTIATSSGLVAGASLMALLITLLRDVMHLIASP